MKFCILKCPKCGRVFAYYGNELVTTCPKYKICTAEIPVTAENIIPVTFEQPNNSSDKMRGWARIFINVFNNNAFLAAEVWSEDGQNTIVLSILESTLGIDHNDVISAIPADRKIMSAYDGLIIVSGKYPVYAEGNKLAAKLEKCMIDGSSV
jgi:hypothetical protein